MNKTLHLAPIHGNEVGPALLAIYRAKPELNVVGAVVWHTRIEPRKKMQNIFSRVTQAVTKCTRMEELGSFEERLPPSEKIQSDIPPAVRDAISASELVLFPAGERYGAWLKERLGAERKMEFFDYKLD